MMTNDDTITKAQAMETNAAQTPAADNNKSGRTAAVGVGASVAGAALGAAAAYAAGAYAEDAPAGAEVKQPAAEQPKPEPEPQPAPEPQPEARQEPEPQPVAHTADVQPESKTGGFLDQHDVKITTIETKVLDDGTTVHVAHGTVDGHQAVFADDGNGKVSVALVDENGNTELDANEIVNLDTQDITLVDLAARIPAAEDPMVYSASQTAETEIQVVSVDHDVDVNGETVDVAVLHVDEEPVLLVDVTQNGEVDLLIADDDHNGSLSDDEMHDVSAQHIPMPTDADVQPGSTMVADAGDGLPDYSNDADITMYEI